LSNSKIVGESKGKIEIVSKTSSGLNENHFTILYTLDKITVIWNGIEFTGRRSTKTWRFPAILDQNLMINEIEKDVSYHLL